MPAEKQLEIATKGGVNVPREKRYFSQNKAAAIEAGRKGGTRRGRYKELSTLYRDALMEIQYDLLSGSPAAPYNAVMKIEKVIAREKEILAT